ncbi:hypothetical protein MMC28_006285 [Mycoblastus sanguinarius]|nr:hypothetical protein [Mycoblastus sanguinarius]
MAQPMAFKNRVLTIFQAIIEGLRPRKKPQPEVMPQAIDLQPVLKDIPSAELQLLDRSPAQTPAHTRVNTPVDNAISDELREHARQMQMLDREVNQTPYHTRAGSQDGIEPVPHTKEEAVKTMDALHTLLEPSAPAATVEEVSREDVGDALIGCVGPKQAKAGKLANSFKKRKAVVFTEDLELAEASDHDEALKDGGPFKLGSALNHPIG